MDGEGLLAPARKPDLPLWKLAVLTLPWLGVQFSWSAEFATQTSYILSLGVSATLTTLTWAAGAVTGLVVQPIVGSLSDRCESKFGRRRPYLFWGMVATVASQLLYAFSAPLGDLMGDQVGHRPAAIAMAVGAVWLLGCAINVIQTPLRSIVADVAPEHQQELGQSLASMWQAIGGIIGFLVAFIWDPLSIMEAYFLTSASMLVITTLVACYIGTEKQYTSMGSSSKQTFMQETSQIFGDMFRGFFKMPDGMRRICLVQFFTWGAWFMYNPNWPAWMGSYIYGGVPQHPGATPTAANNMYAKGTQLGGLGQAIAAAVQMIASFAIPSFSKRFGLRITYVTCFVVFIGTLLGMGLLRPVSNGQADVGAVILMALTGIPLAATNIFPFSIIGRDFGDDPNLALYMGSLNIFIVLPQLLDTTYSGKVSETSGWNVVLLIGAGWAVASTLSIFLLKIVDAKPTEKKPLYSPMDTNA